MWVDDRAGSRELIKPLKQLLGNRVVKKKRLVAGDIIWKGTSGDKWCVEVKHLPDVLKCIADGRFVSQLERMQKRFDQYYLLVVDEFKSGSTGELLLRKRFGPIRKWIEPFQNRSNPVSYQGLTSWLTTMEQEGGCGLWWVQDDGQAARWIAGKYLWSQKEKHKSLDVFDKSRPAPRRNKKGVRFIGKPNTIARVANELVEGIGWDRAKAISYHFGSVEEFIQADVKELMKVKGIGKVTAQNVVDSVKRNHKKGRNKK